MMWWCSSTLSEQWSLHARHGRHVTDAFEGVSGCVETRRQAADFCSDPSGKLALLDHKGIDVYAANLIRTSWQRNRMPSFSSEVLCTMYVKM